MTRPKYRKAYDQKLIKHLAKGQSFESFGSLVDCGRTTLFDWLKVRESFAKAKEVGEAKREEYLVNMGLMLAAGQMRRVVAEIPVLTAHGKPVLDAAGNPLMRKEYGQAKGEVTAWIFLMKNMCKWRNDPTTAVNITNAQGVNVRSEYAQMTDSDIDAKIETLEGRLKIARKSTT